jgi:hypothetical protein
VAAQVCHKCAVSFDPICANSRLFNTSTKRFRAGLIVGKALILKGAKAGTTGFACSVVVCPRDDGKLQHSFFLSWERPMTTFTLRASEELTGQLSSAEMRLWVEDFLRQPHPRSAARSRLRPWTCVFDPPNECCYCTLSMCCQFGSAPGRRRATRSVSPQPATGFQPERH